MPGVWGVGEVKWKPGRHPMRDAVGPGISTLNVIGQRQNPTACLK